jgi:hypothetical protein
LAQQHNNTFHIVGIGASAGGLEALQQFFSNMPANTGMAFVIILHLYSNSHSIMTEFCSSKPGQKASLQKQQALELKLQQSKEELGLTREEILTSQEDMRSTNEELQSLNEDLQSATEELNTSQAETQIEELQAASFADIYAFYKFGNTIK